jgi:predicted nucleic acid-binding protein
VTVIDASVAVKWFVDEDGSDLARLLLETQQGLLHIPDIFVVEVSATLVRNANATKASHGIFRAGLYRLIDLIDRQSLILEHTPPGHVMAASNLAIDLGHPLKDCLYLALAMELGRPLITCDTKFAAKAREVYAGVRVLGG